MKPQINLYNPQLRSAKEILSFRMLLIGMAGAVLLAALGYAWYAFQAGSNARQSRELDARLQALRNETVALSRAIGEQGRNAELDRRQQQLALRYAQMEAMRVALEQATGASSAGFSEFMRAFARQTMPGVWLTGFSVGTDGADMQIDGRAQNPDLVPAFIARLNGEPLLQGRSFAQFAVKQLPADATSTPSVSAAAPAQGRPATAGYHEFRLVSSPSNGVSGKSESQ